MIVLRIRMYENDYKFLQDRHININEQTVMLPINDLFPVWFVTQPVLLYNFHGICELIFERIFQLSTIFTLLNFGKLV